MKPWEWRIAALCIAAITILAVCGKQTDHDQKYQDFSKIAAVVQQALEQFAEENGGFPADTANYRRPFGLNTRYMRWKPEWHIDYEVHPNGSGGKYVCLEFCGPPDSVRYHGLCNRPEFREKYGRGQPIPGYINRIWVVRENAPILPPPPLPPPRPHEPSEPRELQEP